MEFLLNRLRDSLQARELSRGGWPFLRGTGQMALEPTCLALLALGPTHFLDANILVDTQYSDGGWGAFTDDDHACGLTALALLTLNAFGTFDPVRSRAVTWLLGQKGREASWPRRWEFRMRNTRVRFDPSKFGWPWQSGTCSWVVPTALALLALKQSFPYHRAHSVALRIQRGVEMLIDRACPGGGWNAGNGVVYGQPMTSHIDATAIALLALQDEPSNEICTRSLEWLGSGVCVCRSPWSLAWSILALHAYRKPVQSFQQRLACLAESDAFDDTATLATVLLALDITTSRNPFRVVL